MKQKQRRTVSTGTNPETMAQKSRAGLPDLAPAAGRGAPTIEPAPVSAIWENDLFAVTKEGLVLKPPMVILIPKEHLPLVGSVAKSLPVEHSDTPFVEAIDHAVRIHFPDEFPNGLKSKREPEGHTMINPSEITDNRTQGKETYMQKIPCPFTYSNGRACTGHIVRVEAFKADVEWDCTEDGQWRFSFAPRSHYHLFCSEKGNHAGYARPDSEKMKFYGDQLPKPIRDLISKTGVTELHAADLAIEDKKDAT